MALEAEVGLTAEELRITQVVSNCFVVLGERDFVALAVTTLETGLIGGRPEKGILFRRPTMIDILKAKIPIREHLWEVCK